MANRAAHYWKFSIFILPLLFIPAPSAQTLPTPTEVVQQYCNFDFETGRISSANFSKLPPLVTWEEEPGWDTVTVVSGFKILSSKQTSERAAVRVRWEVLGHWEWDTAASEQKSEVVEYQLRLLNGLWKIEAPILPPHVSLSTLRTFVLSQPADDPKRRELWVRNLDLLRQTFDPLKHITNNFPHSIKLKSNGRLLEFCPDNTCDGFVAADNVSVNTLRDFAYLYEFFFSDFFVLEGWRSSPEAQAATHRVLSKAEYSRCKSSNEREAARCALRNLSRGGTIKLIFVRYDEGTRGVVPMDITKELSDKKPTAKEP
jgi:hypothetical protein